jgi:hypothetical protein
VSKALSTGAKGYLLKEDAEKSVGLLSKRFFRISSILVAVFEGGMAPITDNRQPLR